MLVNNSFTHVAYTDETNWNKGRYRGIACVSAERSVAEQLSSNVQGILELANISELSWEKIKDYRKRKACTEVFLKTISMVVSGNLRIDVLLWDTEDSRHTVRRRDDINNIERMYYHLLINVLHTRWSQSAKWVIFPDEHSAFSWEDVEYYLRNKSFPRELYFRLFDDITLNRTMKQIAMVEKQSNKTPLIQVADIFVGMGRYSAEVFEKYEIWKEGELGQGYLLAPPPSISLTNREKARFPVIREINSIFKDSKLGVSLETKKRFQTLNPKNPVNFWWYEPQGSYDKAPTKRNR